MVNIEQRTAAIFNAVRLLENAAFLKWKSGRDRIYTMHGIASTLMHFKMNSQLTKFCRSETRRLPSFV